VSIENFPNTCFIHECTSLVSNLRLLGRSVYTFTYPVHLQLHRARVLIISTSRRVGSPLNTDVGWVA
jgi:hypothetical protein